MKSRDDESVKYNSTGVGVDNYCSGTKPTPKQRGQLIVKRLENFIREGRSDKGGISFKHWQEMAVHEFTNAILDVEREKRTDNQFLTRIIVIGAVAIVTMGFWGAIVAAKVSYDRQMVAFILMGAGSLLILSIGLWGLRYLAGHLFLGRRQERIKRVAKFDQQLAQLDIDLRERIKKKIRDVEF